MRVMVVILTLAASAALSLAQASSENAATIYQRAIDQLNQFRESSPDVYNALMDFDPDVPATSQVRVALAQVQPMLAVVRQGAAAPRCEFPIDREAGMYMMLPHLGQMRSIARMMRADAMVHYEDGDANGAAAMSADLYRISNHFSADDTIISSLVGTAVFSLADTTVQYGLDRGVFGEEESRILQDGLQHLNERDPFDVGGSVAGERDMFGGWMRKRAAEDEPGKIIAEFFGIADGHLDVKDNPLILMTKDQFEHEIDLYDEMMGRMVAIFNMPDRNAAKLAMAEMENDIEAMHLSANHGGEGVVAGMMMPALGKAMERRDMAEKMLSDRRAMLGALATGKATPRDFANAAIWYLRAIAKLEQADAAILKEIRDLSDDAVKPISDELQAALSGTALQEVVDLFREGSRNRRCDFSMARESRSIELVPQYVPGMHDGFRLLHADAIRLIRAGEDERAIDQLSTCLRMAVHLGTDPLIVSSLTSHHNFNKTVAFLKSAVVGADADHHDGPALTAALDGAAMMDPFGYFKSVVAARTEIEKRMLWLSQGLQGPADIELRKREIAESTRLLNADQLLHLLVVFDVMGQNAVVAAEMARPPSTVTSPPPAARQSSENRQQLLARIDDVISLANLEAAQSDSGRLAPLMYQGELILLDGAVPPVASSKWANSLADHIRRASADVRAARALAQTSANEP